MGWRERLLMWAGPSLLAGITFGDWLRLLRENHFAVDARYWPRAAGITARSVVNSLIRHWENARYGRRVRETAVEPPLFLLGIWRSGTTHLHNLFALDERFAFPNWYQVSYPHTFLSTEAIGARLEGFFVPRRRVQDNVRFGYKLPAEDEFALCTVTGCAPVLSWIFPRRAAHYDRYLTLRSAGAEEVAVWKAGLLAFVRKLAWKTGKPLVLKSPPHTARIRLLLELFPDARFVHIHRDPYVVYQSTRHTMTQVMKFVPLQRLPLDVEERTMRQYRELFDAFFEEKALIRPGHFHELRFEDLERDPLGQMRRIYEALNLPDFGVVEPAMRRYVASQSGYEKNVYPALADETKARLAHEWRRCFEAWGYAV